jgi:CheY-like chemotaxis protein
MTTSFKASRPLEVLLVEDNEDDVVLTKLAFDRAGAPVRLHHVGNGTAAMQFLRRQPPHADAPAPDLVLLDLNMPVMDGRAVLAQVRADEALRQLPVVVLTTSAREEDVKQCWRLGCSGYVVKPVDLAEFFEVVRAISTYWCSVIRLPTWKPTPVAV